MAIVTGHDCSHDRVVRDRDKKELVVNRELFINDQARFVVCRLVTEDRLP